MTFSYGSRSFSIAGWTALSPAFHIEPRGLSDSLAALLVELSQVRRPFAYWSERFKVLAVLVQNMLRVSFGDYLGGVVRICIYI